MQRIILIAAALLAGAVQAMAAPQLDDNARRMAETRIAKGELASIVIGVIDGKESAVYSFGKVGGKAPDQHTMYEIGSVSKTFTALLLANAVTTGALALDQPVAKLLPGYAIPAFEGRQITLLDLATQSSGLPRMPDNMAPKRPDNPYADYTSQDMRRFLASHQLARKPGAVYDYSNLGYGLLGMAMAEGAKKTYEELVREQITGPLGMTSTGVALNADMRSRLAPGHDGAGKPTANWDLDAMAGAGALRSNAHDMLRYVQAMMRAATGSAYALAQAPQRPVTGDIRIALGWHLSPVRGQTVVWHNGATGGYGGYAGFTSDGQRGVVVLTNTSAVMDNIALAALAPGAASQPKAIAMTAEALAAYTGRYELAPGFVLAVRPAASGKALQVQATGQPAFEADASAPDEFFLTVVEARLSFKRGTEGAVNSVVLHQNGRQMPGKRLD